MGVFDVRVQVFLNVPNRTPKTLSNWGKSSDHGIGVFNRLCWLETDGSTGLGWFYAPFTRETHLFSSEMQGRLSVTPFS